MRRFALIAVIFVLLLAACEPQSPAPADVSAWKARLEHVTPAATPPPLVRSLLNVGIRVGVPIACPGLTALAAPEYQGFVTATCDAIVASNDPFTTLTATLPALCAGNPPLGATVFPNLAPVLIATCPLILELPALLGVAQYVPLLSPTVAPT